MMNAEKQHKIFMKWFTSYMNLFELLRWEFYDIGISEDELQFLKGGVCCLVKPEQRAVEVYFYPFTSKDLDEKSLKETALHEILHILLMPPIIHGLQKEKIL